MVRVAHDVALSLHDIAWILRAILRTLKCTLTDSNLLGKTFYIATCMCSFNLKGNYKFYEPKHTLLAYKESIMFKTFLKPSLKYPHDIFSIKGK